LKIGIIVQARLTGKRFPNKVLAVMNQKVILKKIVDELKSETFPLVVAIPKTKSNDALSNWLDENQINQFRGFENDVLSRFYACAEWCNFDVIIRVCADSPLISHFDMIKLLNQFLREGQKRMIWGMGFYIFNFKMLKEANFKQVDAGSREHVVRSMMLTVDYPEDIERLEKIETRNHFK